MKYDYTTSQQTVHVKILYKNTRRSWGSTVCISADILWVKFVKPQNGWYRFRGVTHL